MILLITFTEDYYNIDLVRESLERMRIPSIRINMDEFPESFQLSASIQNGGYAFTIRTGGQVISADDVKAVWLRRYWPPKISAEIDPEFRQGCMRESQEVLNIFLHSLRNKPFIDPLSVITNAGNKFFQLELAKELGIRIPRTLITNDPDELKEFFSREKGEIIAKMLTPLTSSMTGTSFFMYTNQVSEDYLDEADMLKHCPMTFQELIPKQYELRVIYVDGQFFTGKIDASSTLLGRIDWRRSSPSEVEWEKYELPGHIKQSLAGLMERLGLLYGAIDIIRSVEGEYVFLEVNPTGEWGMIQRDLGYPIADAIAAALAKRI
jgi:MvdC family ATP-grasp ribosomal peptide maturase